MRIAIIQFPGSNCERETLAAVKRAGMQGIEFLWNQDLNSLENFAGYIIVGGFSYEDRSRSGVIAAQDPLMQVIKQESQKGKPVLGICNGAQILVESGLVPGLADYQLGAALTENKRQHQGQTLGTGFYNTWVHMRLNEAYRAGAFTRYLDPQKIIHLPIAHAEGRFIIPAALLAEMQQAGMNLFQYCDADGKVDPNSTSNPNGSVNSLAAICNKSGNVLAMMPHPERCEQGDVIFQSMRDYIQEGQYRRVSPLDFKLEPSAINPYQKPAEKRELIIELMITDNQQMSVNASLKRLGFDLELKRQIHWEIECDSDLDYEKILRSGVLFNPRKELVLSTPKQTPTAKTLLVRAKEDLHAQQKQEMLRKHFGLKGLKSLRHSILWQLSASYDPDRSLRNLIASHLLFNTHAHDCYYY